ncbi:glycosyltransferase [Sphingomonas azotifigens]|uniref:glycosyltransferase n=1 Tax=Sphingomonas azotifigens TaxID=330920 RepID=UPI000A01B381|nr:glycosyltransferase [Sphingomonas azotifigens]
MRVVLATLGTLGDVHPFIALALGMQARGHTPVFAGAEAVRPIAERHGIEFHAIRPDGPQVLSDLGMDEGAVARAVATDIGFVIDRVVLPYAEVTLADLKPVMAGADLVIGSTFSILARIAAQAVGVPLASALLQPLTLLSAEDPPVMMRGETILVTLRRWFGPGAVRPLLRLAERASARQMKPFAALRVAAGAPPFAGNEMLAGPLAVDRAVGLWSPGFASAPADVPASFQQTGFVFYDGGFAGQGLSAEIKAFLAAGASPLVFTLGSMAVYAEDGFYAASAEAARTLGRRAVLLVGDDLMETHRHLGDANILVAGYAPHSQLFPRAAAVIGHGGIGTTAQAIRAGVPQLVCAIFGDQFDNAARITRAGLGLALPKRRYTGARAAAVIDRLLRDTAIAEQAAKTGAAIAAEDGVGRALDALGLAPIG